MRISTIDASESGLVTANSGQQDPDCRQLSVGGNGDLSP
jgi:hypothetical protein